MPNDETIVLSIRRVRVRHITFILALVAVLVCSTSTNAFAQAEVPTFPDDTSGLTDPDTTDYSEDIFSDFSDGSSSSSSSSGSSAAAVVTGTTTDTSTDTTTTETDADGTTTTETSTETTTVADTESGPATVIIYWMTFIMSFGLLSIYWRKVKRSLV